MAELESALIELGREASPDKYFCSTFDANWYYQQAGVRELAKELFPHPFFLQQLVKSKVTLEKEDVEDTLIYLGLARDNLEDCENRFRDLLNMGGFPFGRLLERSFVLNKFSDADGNVKYVAKIYKPSFD